MSCQSWLNKHFTCFCSILSSLKQDFKLSFCYVPIFIALHPFNNLGAKHVLTQILITPAVVNLAN